MRGKQRQEIQGIKVKAIFYWELLGFANDRSPSGDRLLLA